MKEGALDRSGWRIAFGKVCGLDVWQATEWMHERMNELELWKYDAGFIGSLWQEQKPQISFPCDRNCQAGTEAIIHEPALYLYRTLDLNTWFIATVCKLWRNQQLNPAVGVLTRTKKIKNAHHMSKAVFRLKLSAVDRVGSQPVPWVQCVCLLEIHNKDLSADVLIISKCVWNWNRQMVNYVQGN